MGSCSVVTCRNNYKNVQEYNRTSAKPIRFFNFPKDSDLCEKWMMACGLLNLTEKKRYLICSIHFESSCFEKPLRQLLLNYSPKCIRKLGANAIPTLKLPNVISVENEENPNARSSVFDKREQVKFKLKECMDANSDVESISGRIPEDERLENEHSYFNRLNNFSEEVKNREKESEDCADSGDSEIDVGSTEGHTSPFLNFTTFEDERLGEEHNYFNGSDYDTLMERLFPGKNEEKGCNLGGKKWFQNMNIEDDSESPDETGNNVTEVEESSTEAEADIESSKNTELPHKCECSRKYWENLSANYKPVNIKFKKNEAKESPTSTGEEKSALDTLKEIREIIKENNAFASIGLLKHLDGEINRLEMKEAEESARSRNESARFEEREVEFASMQERIKNLQSHVKEMEKEMSILKHQHKGYIEIVKRFFSKAQLDRLLTKTFSAWDAEDIADAIALRSVSPKAYRYLQKKKGWPLPGLSTLRRWSLKFHLEPGITGTSIMLMKAWGQTLSKAERLTVLSYDETYLSDQVSFDKKREQIVGPHKCVQVVMARGLTTAWKQPIFFEYDFKMNAETYLEIVRRLYTVGFTVVATTSDLGGGNTGIHTALGINVFKTYIDHPSDKESKIFFFADVPHLLKLMRNHLLDHGFLLPGGEKFVSKEGLEQIVKAQSQSDLQIAFKLSSKMLYLNDSERMRVNPAAKLFSNNTARAVQYFGENNLINYPNYIELSKMIKLTNDWFDILNSVAEFGKHHGQNAFTASESQLKILDEMTEFIKQMRVKGHKSTIPFQNGIVITNESLKGLFQFVNDKYEVKFIITRRLNQDVLENFFGFIRSMGRLYTHPDALQFKYRLRLYLLSKHSSTVFSNNTNCEQSEEEEITITSEVFHNALEENPITATEAKAEDPFSAETKDLEEEDLKILSAELPDNFDLNFELLEEFEDFEKKLEISEAIVREALAYVTGYVANRLKNKYPELGFKTADFEMCGEFAEISHWIALNSNGSLLQPSKTFFRAAKAADEVFLQVHGREGFSKADQILSSTVDKILKTRPESLQVPKEAIELYVRTRTYFRIRAFNRQQFRQGKRSNLGE